MGKSGDEWILWVVRILLITKIHKTEEGVLQNLKKHCFGSMFKFPTQLPHYRVNDKILNIESYN